MTVAPAKRGARGGGQVTRVIEVQPPGGEGQDQPAHPDDDQPAGEAGRVGGGVETDRGRQD